MVSRDLQVFHGRASSAAAPESAWTVRGEEAAEIFKSSMGDVYFVINQKENGKKLSGK